jgi:hypothetical protein
MSEMRCEINYDTAQSILKINASGGASVEGYRELIDQMMKHAKWRPGMKTLIDQRSLITDHLSTEAIAAISGLVKSLREKLGNGTCALVMSEPVGINMAKMWKLITQADVHFQISVCNSLEQAESWLKRGY